MAAEPLERQEVVGPENADSGSRRTVTCYPRERFVQSANACTAVGSRTGHGAFVRALERKAMVNT